MAQYRESKEIVATGRGVDNAMADKKEIAARTYPAARLRRVAWQTVARHKNTKTAFLCQTWEMMQVCAARTPEMMQVFMS
jgi:hypothetical protein